MPTLSTDELRAHLLAEYNRPFNGWDFSYLEGRRVTFRPAQTWDYASMVADAMTHARSMLDMDTGGGEKIAALSHRPPITHATEGYAPNVMLARERLGPLGVVVHEVTDHAHLPCSDASFDLVTNRHGAYEPHEVWRVLTPNSLFITQQVGDQTNRVLHALLSRTKVTKAWNLAVAVTAIQAAGFQIQEQYEEFPMTRYYDIGAIVYYLKAIPWEVPDFSVDTYFDALMEMHHRIEADGYIDVPFHHFFIRAQKSR